MFDHLPLALRFCCQNKHTWTFLNKETKNGWELVCVQWFVVHKLVRSNVQYILACKMIDKYFIFLLIKLLSLHDEMWTLYTFKKREKKKSAKGNKYFTLYIVWKYCAYGWNNITLIEYAKTFNNPELCMYLLSFNCKIKLDRWFDHGTEWMPFLSSIFVSRTCIKKVKHALKKRLWWYALGKASE